MSIGTSGRIVIEVEPALKRQLYSILAKDGMTLKDWFLKEARTYMETTHQLKLELEDRTAEAQGESLSKQE